VRKLKRTLSYLLILIMLLQLLLIPMSVSGEKPAEPGIVRELCELRGTNTETYLRTDGLHECVVFSEDAYISKEYPSANYYTNNYLRTGCDDAYGTRRVLINFDIPMYQIAINLPIGLHKQQCNPGKMCVMQRGALIARICCLI
jgi:hypothetical protein